MRPVDAVLEARPVALDRVGMNVFAADVFTRRMIDAVVLVRGFLDPAIDV